MKNHGALPSPAHGRGVGGEGLSPGDPYFRSRGGRGVRARRASERARLHSEATKGTRTLDVSRGTYFGSGAVAAANSRSGGSL